MGDLHGREKEANSEANGTHTDEKERRGEKEGERKSCTERKEDSWDTNFVASLYGRSSDTIILSFLFLLIVV
jgi:hypothetical protein